MSYSGKLKEQIKQNDILGVFKEDATDYVSFSNNVISNLGYTSHMKSAVDIVARHIFEKINMRIDYNWDNTVFKYELYKQFYNIKNLEGIISNYENLVKEVTVNKNKYIIHNYQKIYISDLYEMQFYTFIENIKKYLNSYKLQEKLERDCTQKEEKTTGRGKI